MRVIEFDYNPVFARDRNVPGNADFDLRVAGRRADNFTICPSSLLGQKPSRTDSG